MHISKLTSLYSLSFLPGVIASLAAFFFIFTGISVSAQAAPEWETMIQGLESQQVLGKEQAEALREHMRENSSSAVDLEWHFNIQTQAAWTKARTGTDNEDSSYNTVELRRLRWGLTANFGSNLVGEAELNLVPGDTDLREATLSWEPTKVFNLRVGYDKPFSSLDENTSSKKLLTVERSHISNTVADPGKSSGLLIDGAADHIYYGLGVFTDQDGVNTEGEASKWMHNFLIGVTGDGPYGTVKGQATWMMSKDAKGLVGSEFEKAGSLGFVFDNKAFQLQAEVLKGEKDSSKIEGVYILTAYTAGKNQFVLRGERAEAQGTSGIGLPGRYSGDTGLLLANDLGDLYTAAYLGWNYNFAPNNKVMVGLEGAELSGTSLGKVKANTLFLAWRAFL